MDDKENHHFLRPLHAPTTTNSDVYTNSTAANTTLESRNNFNNFSFRLAFIAVIALVSVWASQEASKGFTITIINEAGDTSAGKRFHLFYVSNDGATRLILETSKFVDNFLYPSNSNSNNHHHHPKKKISHVTLRLSSRNLTRQLMTHSGEHGEHVIHLCPRIMYEPDFKHATLLAVQRGMARVWLWDGQGNAPTSIVNGMVDYITTLAVSGGFPSGGAVLPEYSGSGGCWEGEEDPRAVAGFLNYCEGKRQGFVRRLNQKMENDWHDDMLDYALGDMPARTLCDAYHSSSDLSASSI